MNDLPKVDSDLKAYIMLMKMAKTQNLIDEFNTNLPGSGDFLLGFMNDCLERLKEYDQSK